MLQPGSMFGDYRVVKLLGRGGMGEVWLLKIEAREEYAAVKLLYRERGADHESRKRFLREAEFALNIYHPNLARVYDVGQDPETGLCFILMEYMPGGSLKDLIAQGPLSVEETVRIAVDVARALGAAADRGIVHRDVKPDNIMFASDGTAKLIDLGIVRRLAGTVLVSVTTPGAMVGTPAYMPPEQMIDSSSVTSAADVFSLGVVMWEMLVGRRPYADDGAIQILARVQTGKPFDDVRKYRPDVPAWLARLIAEMTAFKVADRIASPWMVKERLENPRLHEDPQVAANAAQQMRLHVRGKKPFSHPTTKTPAKTPTKAPTKTATKTPTKAPTKTATKTAQEKFLPEESSQEGGDPMALFITVVVVLVVVIIILLAVAGHVVGGR